MTRRRMLGLAAPCVVAAALIALPALAVPAFSAPFPYLVFFWTPPHFWALALLLSRQYSAAKVPMLPVVAGERRTRLSILFYSLLMLGVSALPIVWLGPIYAVACIALGAVFLWLAGRASRRRDAPPAMG